MANIDHSRQENYSSKAARNIGAIQRPFSGTVIGSLQNASSPGRNAQGFIGGSSDALNRPRVIADGDGVFHEGALVSSRSTAHSYGTSGIISPMQRSQELSAQHSGSPVFIVVQRRDNFADTEGETVGLSDDEKGTLLRQKQDAFVQEYHDLTDPTTAKLVRLCGAILNVDVNIEQKYAELDIRRVLEANQEKTHFLHLTQGLGILEKYASNLIKESRPPYWRTVKFTSTLIQVHVAQLIGSRDILSQIGYTQDIADGVAFPASVTEPDVNRLKNLAPDLFFARYEIDALISDTHPFYELKPKIPQGEIQSPVLMRRDVPPSRPQRFPPSQQSALPQAAVVTAPRVAAMLTSTFATDRRSQSPIPAVRRNRGRDPVSSSAEKELKTSSHTNQEPQTSTDKNSDSEEESEYEDAEDGILSCNDSTLVQTNFECRVCGESTAEKFCKDCRDTFCRNCDEVYHKHPSRQHHVRTELLTSTAKRLGSAEQPVKSATTPTRTSETRKQCGPVASPVITATNTNIESRPRPVPAPRRNKAPLPSNQSATQNTATTEPQKGIQSVSHKPQDKSSIWQPTNVSHPADTIRFPPPFHGSVATPITSRAQTRESERQILRPPPFPQAALNKVDEGDNKQVDKGTPASTHPLKPKVPVESKAVREEVAKSSALSCPICFCLNAGDAKTCIFCMNQLPATTQTSDQSLSRLPTPKLPSSQHSMQQSKANASIVSSSGEAVDPDKWECEYCTFHNPKTRRICEVCCKTSSNIPLPVRSAEIPGTQRNFQNMVMQSNVQPMQSIADPLKRVEPQKLQASQEEAALSATKKGQEISEQSGIETTSQKFPSSSSSQAEAPAPGPASPPVQQQGFSSAFPQHPPNLATTWSTSFPDESVRRHQEEIYIAGFRYVEWLRKAEKDGFSAEELNIACVLAIDDPEGPIHWLHTSWFDLIHKVMLEVAIPENSQEIGNVSPEEAREALIECTGEVSRATAKCMEIRKKKVKELQKAGVYAKTDCILALDGSKGDTEKAINSLERMAMHPMLQRVLNSCLPNHATPDDVFQVLTRQIDTRSPQDKANFEAIVKDKAQNLDRRIRAVLVEKNVSSWGRAETAIKLIDRDFSVDDSIEAAIYGGDVKQALRYLQQDCPLCLEQKPMSQMVTFLHCQDRVCGECVNKFVTITIKDKNILHLVCPVCGKPENLEDEAVANEYFNHFDILIRGLVDQETHDLFQRKLRDRTLMKEPSFRWCSHCSSGFINEQPGQLKMMCPHCRQHTCFKCKRQWEDQHEGISCEQFEAWKAANDPEFQAAGLAAHLKMNGIVCPRCKFRYDLAKGGCMHFKCAMCPHEFCSGCYKPFINNHNEQCGVSEECQLRGLHAHHPRDCYFYLRDRSPQELQKLLHDNNIAYDTEPPEGQENTASGEEVAGRAAAAEAPLRCKVSEQKESENGLQDAECGEEVPPGHAGLCGKHYKEYLVVLVNDNLLDPADIMSCDDLKCVLRRGFVPTQAQRNRMTEEQYRQLLLQTVKDHLPLPGKPPRKRVLDENEVALPNIEEDVEDLVNDFIDIVDDDDWEEDIRFDQRDEHSY
ncbi:E3 ubiquitin-protein ligase RNF31-like isoform X2 [Acropora palmata]|uniref:E3 ubiquitin-protein ligase RNF31-like isoform X2 n=1 Tax=Acropora palmata TaxID=6131 RepID=UPI003DA006B6